MKPAEDLANVNNLPKSPVSLTSVRLFEVVLFVIPGLLHVITALAAFGGVLAGADVASVHVTAALGFLQAFPGLPTEDAVMRFQVVSKEDESKNLSGVKLS